MPPLTVSTAVRHSCRGPPHEQSSGPQEQLSGRATRAADCRSSGPHQGNGPPERLSAGLLWAKAAVRQRSGGRPEPRSIRGVAVDQGSGPPEQLSGERLRYSKAAAVAHLPPVDGCNTATKGSSTARPAASVTNNDKSVKFMATRSVCVPPSRPSLLPYVPSVPPSLRTFVAGSIGPTVADGW